MERPMVTPFIALVGILLLGYIILVVSGHTEEARPLGELITIVVTAIVTYYLGWSQRQMSSVKSSSKLAHEYGHITKQNIARLGYVAIGFGIALILEHIICYGIDLELTELLVGHEWIGLYAIAVGMVLIGYAKKLGYYLKNLA